MFLHLIFSGNINSRYRCNNHLSALRNHRIGRCKNDFAHNHIAEQLKRVKTPVVLVINKIDMVKKEEVLSFIDAYRTEYDFADIVPVSARAGTNTNELVKVIMKYLPYGPQFYDEDTITDQPERQPRRQLHYH